MLAKTRILIAILWLPLTVSLPSACLAPLDEEARRLWRQADSALKRGELGLAEKLAREGFEGWQDQPEALWHWEFRLLLSEALLRYRNLEGVKPLLDPEVPPGSEFDGLRCLQALNRARLRLQADKLDFQAAARLLQEAEDLAAKLGSDVLLARIQLRKGYWHKRKAESSSHAGRPGLDAKAKGHFEDAARKAEQAGDLYWMAATRGSLGFFLMERFRFDEAIPQFENALEVARRVGDGQSIGKSMGNLGWCYAFMGNFDKALRLLKRAEEEAAKIGLLTDQQRWLGDQGVVYYWKREFDKAIPPFQQASQIAHQVGDTDFEASWLNNLANVLIRKGEWKAAQEYNQEALKLIEGLSEEGLNDFILYFQLNSADIAIGQRRFREAENILKGVLATSIEDPTLHWEAQAALGGLYVKMERNREAEQSFEAALQSFDRARAGLNSQDPELFITFQERRMEYLQAYVDFLMQNGQPDRALWVVESSRAQVLAEELGRDLAEPGHASQFQQTAHDLDAVLLSYWIAPERSYLWAVTAKEIQAFALPGQERIERQVYAYGLLIQRGNPLGDLNLLGGDLYETLLGPLKGILKPGGRAVLAPSGGLNNLNFETLIVPEPSPHYWIEDVTLVHAPSLAFLQPPRSNRTERDSYLLMAYSPQDDPLPHVDDEIREINNSLKSRGLRPWAFLGSEARSRSFEESAIMGHLLIHFAAHAEANPESPLNSYVTLSDRLYARTVASTKLAARLVTVSACQSAGAQSYGGEGLVGLAWAFLYAGAENVVAGLWNVNDRSSFELMRDFYSALAAGLHPAAALRQAKLDMLASSGPHSRPYHWAPFQLYTHSSPFVSLFEPSGAAEPSAETNGP